MNSDQRQDIKDRKEQAFKMWQYAIQRIDLLIISICGAGIYVTLETLKYIKDNSLGDSLYVKIAGGFFLGAIIINFVSQFLGKKANEKDIRCGNEKLEASDPVTSEQKAMVDKLHKESQNYTKWTNISNNISLAGLLIGLSAFVYYFMSTF